MNPHAFKRRIAEKHATKLAKSELFIQMHFYDKSKEIDKLILEAKKQFEVEDHTRLCQPVHYRILWLGYTHVTYQGLDFQMNDFDQDYLRSVVVNFKNVVENYSDHNIEIKIDLFFINKCTPLTKYHNRDWLFLSSETISSTINQFDEAKHYDTVFTTVQTKGKDNEIRNQNKPNSGKSDVILGLKTHGIEHQFGYSTFNLFEPKKGTFPLKNPSVPSLYATAVAIHEWLHQFEYLGDFLDIEFPRTHAYQGEPDFPGYQKVISDKNNYDYLEFYESVLRGTCPYTLPQNSGVKKVGMYPKMWPLISRGILDIGVFTIRNVADNYYLSAETDQRILTKTIEPFNWIFRYDCESAFILIAEKDPTLRIDLDNGWDLEGTTVKLFTNKMKQYRNAQRWLLSHNTDGTFCIRTSYKSRRAISFNDKTGAIIKFEHEPIDSQKWIISSSQDNRINETQAVNIINWHLQETVSKIKIMGMDAYQVNLGFGNELNAASFAVTLDGNQLFLQNKKTGKFEKIQPQ